MTTIDQHRALLLAEYDLKAASQLVREARTLGDDTHAPPSNEIIDEAIEAVKRALGHLEDR